MATIYLLSIIFFASFSCGYYHTKFQISNSTISHFGFWILDKTLN